MNSQRNEVHSDRQLSEDKDLLDWADGSQSIYNITDTQLSVLSTPLTPRKKRLIKLLEKEEKLSSFVNLIWDMMTSPNPAREGNKFKPLLTLKDTLLLMSHKFFISWYHEGYIFNCEDAMKDRPIHYFWCETKHCKASLITQKKWKSHWSGSRGRH